MKHGNKYSKILKTALIALLAIAAVYIGGSGISSLAAKAVCVKAELITDFTQELTYDQFNTLRKGKTQPVKENGKWYYLFTEGKNAVKMPQEAFTNEQASNDYTEINKELTKTALKPSGESDDTSYIYKRYEGKTSSKEKGTKYSVYLCHVKVRSYKLESSRFILSAEMMAQVEFTYSTKVKNASVTRNGTYVTPSTKNDYKRALYRNDSDYVDPVVTPSFRVEITQPGTSCIYLNAYSVAGKGEKAKEKKDIRGLIKDVQTYKKTFETISKMVLEPKISTGYDIISSAVEFIPSKKDKSEAYNDGKKIPLSKKNKENRADTFESPLPFYTYKDFVIFNVWLSGTPTAAGKNKKETKISISFELN